MSIIIIASDAYTVGHEISLKAAEALDYNFLGRDLLARIGDKYQIEEKKLLSALDDRPSFLKMGGKLRNRCLSYIQEATLGALLKEKQVCHGLAAHLYVLGVSHVLRVLILAKPEQIVQQYDSNRKLSRKDAGKIIERHNRFRRRWSEKTFGMDETDPSHYDLTISLSQIDADEAIKIMEQTISYRRFSPMTYSVKCLQNLELAARVRVALLPDFPDVRVHARSGTLTVETAGLKREKQKKAERIKTIAGQIPGVEHVEAHVKNDIFRQAAESFR